jgi:6-phosphogluconolactonase
MKKIEVYPDLSQLYTAVADFFADRSRETVARFGKCTLALPGGTTPRGLYALLSREPYRSLVPWPQVHVFWGDERCVPKNDCRSNYRLAYELLLAPLSVPELNVHRVVVENIPSPQAAERYEKHLRQFFQLAPGQFPMFDLILLGMGPDGHTASLFPQGPELKVVDRLVTWSQKDPSSPERVTLTLQTINRARNVAFLIAGSDKATALRSVLDEDRSFPAALVKPDNHQLTFFVDEAAYVT